MQCYAERGIAIIWLSVSLSATLVDCDHIHWDSWNVFSRIIRASVPLLISGDL